MPEWITFAEAGRAIDGIAGWTMGNGGERMSAQALLNFASRGDIPVIARQAILRVEDSAERPATPAEQTRFIALLLAREKLSEDVFTAFDAPGMC